jgi:hypothetical protein
MEIHSSGIMAANNCGDTVGVVVRPVPLAHIHPLQKLIVKVTFEMTKSISNLRAALIY